MGENNNFRREKAKQKETRRWGRLFTQTEEEWVTQPIVVFLQEAKESRQGKVPASVGKRVGDVFIRRKTRHGNIPERAGEEDKEENPGVLLKGKEHVGHGR